MGYVVAALALMVVGLAVALVRMSGKLAEQEERAAAAERGVDAFKTANEILEANKSDEVGRLERIIVRYRSELDKASADLITCQDPHVRKARLSDLGRVIDIIPAPKKPAPAGGK